MSDDKSVDDFDDFEKEPQPESAIAEVSVTGPGISIKRPVDEATMSDVIALLFGGALSAPEAPSGRGGLGTVGPGAGSAAGPSAGSGGGRSQQSLPWDRDLTLGEFITEVGARSFPQKICAAGYYLINFQGAESFARDEVRAALADAHEDMPANFSRDWANAASSHLIAAKQGEAGRFIIPRTGRTAVTSHFQEVPKRRAARKTAKKSSPNGDAE
ncbi:hypothetical protein [Nocardioides zeae]|uniref:Uncharacterized protein n=1 Tax=Nocardioides zeae TaxID=1457234 RepID=A0A6P0HHL7_9ACTN|nr:hypothetical protein [Nocardioides zeae]NEN77125.1 hypothetical protein [Nocardioides zeae]